jgi:hypothetical protein
MECFLGAAACNTPGSQHQFSRRNCELAAEFTTIRFAIGSGAQSIQIPGNLYQCLPNLICLAEFVATAIE